MNICTIFVHALAPARCLVCGAAGPVDGICRGCLRDLPRIACPCPRCGRPVPTGGSCGACLASPPAFDAARAPYAYAFPVDRLVQGFKYGGRLDHGRLLGRLLARALLGRPDRPSLLVPVPLHPRRLRARGFDQAVELARTLGRRLGLPVAEGLCLRVTDTPPLWPLDAAARRRVLGGAFRLARAPGVDRVALVDDVLTSGATAGALARVLKAAGVAWVEIWAPARGGV